MKRILSIVLTLALLLTALPLALSVSAADVSGQTVTYTFADYSAGTQYAENEVHAMDGNLTITTTQAHFTTELRLYSSSTHDGYAILNSTNYITALSFNMGNKVDTLVIYGSTDDGSTWSEVSRVATTSTSYNDYAVTIAGDYNYLKLDVLGTQQIRIKSIAVTYGNVAGGSSTPSCTHSNLTYTPVDAGLHSVVCSNPDCLASFGNTSHDFSNGDCICGQSAPEISDIEDNTVIFEFGENVAVSDDATDHKDGDDIGTSKDFKDTTDTYTLTLTNANKVFEDAYDEMGNSCIKLGTGSVAGTFKFTAPDNVVKVIFSVAQYKANTTKISINGGATQTITTASNNGEYTAVEVDTNTTKSITFSTVSGGYRAMLNSITFLTANAEEECTHENKTTTNTATYFKDGKVTVVCDDCGETVSETEATATDVALTSSEENFADGKLTITLTYSEDLLKDIDNGAEIYFNYSIDGYSNSIEISYGTASVITLEGFNADRLDAQLTYYLTAVYTGVNTDKLVDATTRTLTVAEKIDANSEIGTLMNALNATDANTVVSTKIAATTHFAENTITADIKAGTMVLNFIASNDLVAKLAENSGLARTNKITVTIDGVANIYEFTPEVMRKSTTIKISGMSFAQLNGAVTIKVDFIYGDTSVDDITDTITFEGAKAVDATNSAVATAFKNYIAE